jgi:uncharacterized protein YjdB
MKLLKLFFLSLVAFAFSTGCNKNIKDSGDAVTDVKLFAEEASLVLGTSSTFTATVEPKSAANKKVTWTSSDPTVATITEAGLVTALKLGNTTLTATTVEGNISASCTLTVTETIIDVSSISLKTPPVSVPLNGTAQLIVAIIPANATNQNLTWKSSDESIITVNETGEITGKALGVASVTATSVDGGYSASAEITVTSGTLAVTSISLPPTADTYPGGTVHLTAVIQPALATNNKITWSSSDESVATISQTGLLTGIALGTATITVTTEDGNKTATSLVTVGKENLLLNPGFENDLTSWTKVYGSNSFITTDPNFVHSGTKALVIGNQEGEGRGQIITSGFTPGVNYTFTAWCKMDVITGYDVQFAIQCYSEDSRLKDVSAPDLKALTWTKGSFTTQIPAGTVAIHVFIYNNGGRTVYTDDWTFTKD